MKNRFRLLAVVLAFGSVAAACSSETTRADLIEELTSDGSVTEAQANCIADGVEEAGIDYGLSEDDATPEDVETLTSITFDCLLGG